MDRGVAVLLAAVFGGIVALQPAVNAELGRFTGSWPAVLVNFAVGTLVLAALVAIMGDLGNVGQARHAPWWSVVRRRAPGRRVRQHGGDHREDPRRRGADGDHRGRFSYFIHT